MKDAGDRAVDSEQPRGGRVDGAGLGKFEGPSEGEARVSDEVGWKERFNGISVRLLAVVDRYEINVEIPKETVKVGGKGECVLGPVDLGTINEMYNAHIKHIKDGKCGFSGRVLEKR